MTSKALDVVQKLDMDTVRKMLRDLKDHEPNILDQFFAAKAWETILIHYYGLEKQKIKLPWYVDGAVALYHAQCDNQRT